MGVDVAGLGNALMDALVVLEDDALLGQLGLVRGTMHPVDHTRWMEIHDQVKHNGVVFASGGSCANTVAAVGRLGASAIYCGQVGEDQMGRLYGSLMEEACGKHALRFTREEATGKCLSIISKADAERTMVTDLGAAVALPSLGAFASDLSGAKIAHFTGYTLLDGPMRAVALDAMKIAHDSCQHVSLDAADPFVVAGIRDLLWEVLESYIDIVFLNADEAFKLTDMPAREAALHIHERANVGTVVVKMGSQGSVVFHEDQHYEIGIVEVDAIDTTGAGDAYAGGFLYGVANGWSADQCGRLASAVAAMTVAQIGAVVKDEVALRHAISRATMVTA